MCKPKELDCKSSAGPVRAIPHVFLADSAAIVNDLPLTNNLNLRLVDVEMENHVRLGSTLLQELDCEVAKFAAEHSVQWLAKGGRALIVMLKAVLTHGLRH